MSEEPYFDSRVRVGDGVYNLRDITQRGQHSLNALAAFVPRVGD